MKKETFGQRLKLLREQKGYTLRELADKMNISYSALGNYERDVREPSFAIIEKLTKFFDVDAGYLLGISNCKNPANTFIVKDLGLSENSINIIKELESSDAKALNELLENAYLIPFIRAIDVYKTEFFNLETAKCSYNEFEHDLTPYFRDVLGVYNLRDFEFMRFKAIERLLELILNRPKDILYPTTKDTP